MPCIRGGKVGSHSQNDSAAQPVSQGHRAGERLRVARRRAADTLPQCEKEQGPFEAILAFSMGAVFAQIVCAARACHASPLARAADAVSPVSSTPYMLPSLKFAVSALDDVTSPLL